MFLTRLIYTSTIAPSFSADSIEEILVTARRNNSRNNVTGMLCFNRKYFLQCLEGSRTAVNNTYHNILNDPRHSHIIMLDYKEIVTREYAEWSMGYMPESGFTAGLNLKFSGTPGFNPYEMLGESAQQMMLAMKEIVPSKNKC
ncbi:BLUF domain-containing protein [Alteromonas gilva]|uniref:BLUF domain-containing protein n=1 Tax=Alteromonas gilva TaxID=2987522 RepID=A0ABT5L0R1_9ALTE|nr:BLUF domain-containing protein [Alteromonas gilva]MDC8830607.1 BLUF domain-containing protein [Alteromonas gilva]